MPTISTPVGTTQTYIPIVSAGQRTRLPAVPVVFDTIADLVAAVTVERANITDVGAGIWVDSQPLGVASEVRAGVWRTWSAASQHARTAGLPDGTAVTLAVDGGTVLAGTGAPSSATGADGDVWVDTAGSAHYARAAGVWTRSGSLRGAAAAAVSGAPSGLMRLIGSQGVTATGNPASTVRPNWLFKFEAEAPVRAVRLWVYSREYIEVSRDWEFAVASTEVAGHSTLTDAFIPQATPPVGWPNAGARQQYNNYVATTDATVNGWRRGTWGGSTKSGLLYPGADLAVQDYGTSGAYSAIPGMICSDIIPIRSVAPASGSRPFILLRLTRTPKLGDTHSWVNVYPPAVDGDGQTYLYGLMRAALDGQPYGRVIYAQEFNGSDSVNNLATMPSSVLSFDSSNSTNMGMPYIGLEYFYDVPTRSLMALGDSTYESGGWQKYGLMSWIPMAVLSKSTPAAPWTYYNGGASTCHSSTFIPQLEQHIRMGHKPTDVMIPAMSTNELQRAGGGTQTAKIADEAIARNEHILALCRKHSIRALISSSIYPAGYGPGGPFNVHDTVDKWARAATSAGHATLVDLRSGMQPSYLTSADAYYHLTAAGNEYARGVLAAVL